MGEMMHEDMQDARPGRCDPHTHTTYSDGMGSPREVVEKAIARGLDVVAITDHDTVEGALEAREIVLRERLPIEVIVGIEVTAGRGVHMLALFVEERLPMMQSAAQTVKRIAALGGIALAPHPLTVLTPSMGEGLIDSLLAAHLPLSGVETINPSPAGRPGARVIALNKKWGLAEFGGSDAHFLPHIGAAYTEFPGRTAADFRHALEERTTRARRDDKPLARIALRDYARQSTRSMVVNPIQKVVRKLRPETASRP